MLGLHVDEINACKRYTMIHVSVFLDVWIHTCSDNYDVRKFKSMLGRNHGPAVSILQKVIKPWREDYWQFVFSRSFFFRYISGAEIRLRVFSPLFFVYAILLVLCVTACRESIVINHSKIYI